MSVRETFLGGVAVPPLESRILDDFGVKTLHAIAKRQRMLMDCTAVHLPARSTTNADIYTVRSQLEFVGAIQSRSRYGKSNGAETYTLTEKGWDIVGDKPLHL